MKSSHFCGAIASLVILVRGVTAQGSVPNSFPHDYPGIPSGEFGPEWQDYYLVKEGSLPNATFDLNRNFAGTLTVNRTNHPNDTLFFWAFENSNGSLTQDVGVNDSAPWGIWLNGGPGASSLLGLLLENGPIHIAEDGGLVKNNFSWDQFMDYVWVDQPVGTGFSTAESDGGYIEDEDQMGEDFLNFLTNLVKIFPSLATRPFYLTGESYAGTYIPYITKAIFSTTSPPVNLVKIAIGNGAMGSEPEYEELPALSIVETYPQLIGYDPEVYEYFREQSHLCGYDFNLTYPQNGKFPPVGPPIQPTEPGRAEFLSGRPRSLVQRRLIALARGEPAPEVGIVARKRALSTDELEERELRRRDWVESRRELRSFQKRDLSGRANGTIDPQYGCFLMDEVEDYALNFSMPWNLSSETVINDLDDFGPFNPYNVPDARNPPLALDPSTFMNDNQTRTALHAPTSKNWTLQINYPFNSSFRQIPGSNPFGDPSVEAVAFFDELAANASEKNVKVVIYLGNDDTVVPHLSSEITIQNTTFGGIQGFSQRPSTPWFDDNGVFAGIIHQERNWTYILVEGAGHEVPEFQPEFAFVMFREFILGNNETGLLLPGTSTPIGGSDPLILQGSNNILQGESSILFGSGTATSQFIAPSATIEAWETFWVGVLNSEMTETVTTVVSPSASAT